MTASNRVAWAHLMMRSSSVALFLVLSSIAGSARAQTPIAALRKSHERINELLAKERTATASDKAAVREEIKRVVNGFLDYRELSRRALDQHWAARSKKEQDEFVAVLRELIERNYVKQLRDNLDYEVIYKDQKIDGPEATVHTIVRVSKRGRAVDTAIDYQLRRGTDGWVVFDIITDDTSLVRTYRSQFNRIIQRESYDALIKKMRRKLGES